MILDPLSDKDKVRGSLHTLQVKTKIGVTTSSSSPFRTSEMHSLSSFLLPGTNGRITKTRVSIQTISKEFQGKTTFRDALKHNENCEVPTV